MLKVYGLGLFGSDGEPGYLEDPWNRFDGFLVTTSLIDLLPIETPNMSIMRLMRVLRSVP